MSAKDQKAFINKGIECFESFTSSMQHAKGRQLEWRHLKKMTVEELIVDVMITNNIEFIFTGDIE